MRKLLGTMLGTLSGAAVAMATPAMAAKRDTPDMQLNKLLEGRVAGEPVNCIPVNSVTSSQIIDGKAIVYRIGSRMYVNTPRSGADRLDGNDILLTRNYGSQLCRVDAVQLVDRNSRFVRSFVVLDRFVPYTRAAKPD